MSLLDKIITSVKGVAPTVANLVLPGSGPLLHGLMRQVTGDDPDTDIEAVAAKINQDPQLTLELKRLAVDREVQLAQIRAGNLRTVNETMRVESKSEHWPQYSWRPFNGFTFPLAVLAIYALLPAFDKTVPAVPEMVWIGWLSILGVATWDRGKEKRAKAGELKTGLLAGAIKAIRG